MARLSGYLTGQLANPSYAGMLGQGIQSGMQGISDAIAAKRTERGQDSILTMLTNADPNDPNTIQSVQAVSRQMHMDPTKTQAMINSAQDQAMAKERMAMSRTQMEMAKQDQEMQVERQKWAAEQHVWARADQMWQEKTRKREEEERMWTANAEAALARGFGAATAVLDSAPAEYQTAIRDHIQRRQEWDVKMSTMNDWIRAGQDVPESELKMFSEWGDYGQQAVARYNKEKESMGTRYAAAQLRDTMDRYQSANAYQGAQASKPKAASARDIEDAMDIVDLFHASETPRRFWFDKDDPKLKRQMAEQLAYYKKNNPGLTPTADLLKTIRADVEAGKGPGSQNLVESQGQGGGGLQTNEQKIKWMMDNNKGRSREEAIQRLIDIGQWNDE